MVLSCTICEIWVIGQKSQTFYNLPVFSAPAGGDLVEILRRCLILAKTRMIGLRCGEKNYNNIILSRFNTIPERDGQTDRQTDRWTGRIPISISRVSIAVLTCDKNVCKRCCDIFKHIDFVSNVFRLTSKPFKFIILKYFACQTRKIINTTVYKMYDLN